MQIKMTIDECLEFADEWARGCTFNEGSQGWRVVCTLLAEEVRRLQGLIVAHVSASNNDGSAGDTFGALMEVAAARPNAELSGPNDVLGTED